VAFDDGSVTRSRLVIDASGRRTPMPGWLAEQGMAVADESSECGITYLTRFYQRSSDAPELPLNRGFAAGGSFDSYSCLVFPGDAGTFSVTFGVLPEDRDLRALRDGAAFNAAVRSIPALAPWIDADHADAISDVRTMAGLLNRIRRFTDDAGDPLVVGFHALGDSHTTTNPLYGRGCSLAAVQACLLTDAFAAHPDDPVARSAAYEAGSAREVEPWYESAVQMDQLGADPAGTSAFGGGDGDAGRAMAAVFVAAATDPSIGRGIARFMNLLQTPAQLLTDGELMQRVAEVVADPGAYPTPRRVGPGRRELLAQLETTAA
jgi:hypothetical protein